MNAQPNTIVEVIVEPTKLTFGAKTARIPTPAKFVEYTRKSLEYLGLEVNRHIVLDATTGNAYFDENLPKQEKPKH